MTIAGAGGTDSIEAIKEPIEHQLSRVYMANIYYKNVPNSYS